MNFGPHQAKAPVTNATQVKPSVDNMNDGFLDKSTKKTQPILLKFRKNSSERFITRK